MYQGGGAKQIRVVCVSLSSVHERPEPTPEIEKAGRENWRKFRRSWRR